MMEIHERAKVQAVLVQSQKMEALGQLTGGIAHDFNNLLNVIMVNAELIARVSGDERICGMAATVKRATERGAKLTGQLLTFSRNSNLDLKAIDVVALLQGMRDIITVSLGSSIRYTNEFDRTEMWTRADANQLELAILNLAINARDAMPAGGQLGIRVKERAAPDQLLKDGRYVVVEVADTGSGVPPEVVSRVFDPFFTTKPIGKGTGLGLSQVHGFTHQAGGTVKVASEIGKGTEVTILLPRESAGSQPEEAEAGESGGSGTVLLVEDNPDVASVSGSLLEQLGYTVQRVADAEAALRAIEHDGVDLVFSDIVMPGKMDGLALAHRLRQIRPDLPILLATGYSDAAANVRGDFPILRKPYEIHQLSQAIAKLPPR
jgi:CheY-like chemotaxis protein/two-component sensor histidine kinase